ncbi:MAG: hypothetical protein JRI80_19020, partial [Deltaproteobacteria bacterium]|nr:hypothetical protein [Deltaproteobacteria bacterium]
MMNNVPNTSRQPHEALPPGITGEIVAFAGFLKARGYKVFQSSILDSLRSLRNIALSSRTDFFNVLRVNFASSDIEWAQFGDLFEAFFKVKKEEPQEDESLLPSNRIDERKEGAPEELAPEV